jgi:tRNA(Ile)-lysidine synthase
MPAPTFPSQAAMAADATPELMAAPQPLSAAPIARQLQQQLSTVLAPFAQQRIIIALSGGLDSMVLLDVLAQLQANASWSLHAVYVHHGLQAANDDWLYFCQQQCELRQIPFTCHHLQLQLSQNIEAQAREARYAVLEAYTLQQPSVVLTAHHADDQLETLLLSLKRGSGLTGLCGIAAQKNFGAGYLVRPLLLFSRAQLEAYAAHVQLAYVTDPSNLDLHFDRNFMRHQVVAPLKQRFPAIAQTAARSMAHLADIEQQQQRLIAAVAAPCIVTATQGARLIVSKLLALDPLLQPLVLRYFFAQHQLSLSQQQLQQVQRDVLTAAPDRQPKFRLGDTEIRRYADALYCLSGPSLRYWQVQPIAVDFRLDIGVADLTTSNQAVVSGTDAADATRALAHLVLTQNGQEQHIPLSRRLTTPFALPLDCYQHQDWPAFKLMVMPHDAESNDVAPNNVAPYDVASQQATSEATELWSWLPLSSQHRYRLGPVASQTPFKPSCMPAGELQDNATAPSSHKPLQQWFKKWQVPVWQRPAVLGLWQEEQLCQLWPLTTSATAGVNIDSAAAVNIDSNPLGMTQGMQSAIPKRAEHGASTDAQNLPYVLWLGWSEPVASRFEMHLNDGGSHALR